MSKHASNQKYQKLRDAAYTETSLSSLAIDARGKIKLTPINESALTAHENWPDIGRMPPSGGWSWRSFMPKFRNGTARFELAIWHNNQLCGMAVGRPSNSKILLKIELIEGTTENVNPLKGKIVPITLFCAETYADLINSDEVRIMSPATPELVIYYSHFEYSYVSGNKRQEPYLYKKI